MSSAILRIRGPDANSYLQGQFTQDLKLCEVGPIYGLWLDQKGKVLRDSHIIRLAHNDYLVVGFSGPSSSLLARLAAYLIADEVELADETSAWTGVLLWGEDVAHKILPDQVLAVPSRRAGNGSVQWLVPAARLNEVTAALRKIGTVESNAEAAQRERLSQGVPSVPVDIGPNDLPAEGALDEVAISFTKGCYLGQEVIARLKNLGKVRRRLHLVRGAGNPPAAGAPLYQGERKAGEMRSAAIDGDDFIAMAMLSLINLDPDAPLSLRPSGEGPIRILRCV